MWWNKYINIRFEEKGRTMDSGDCWNIPFQVYKKELGIALPSYLEFYENTDQRDILSNLILSEKQSKWESVTEPKEFDIAILKLRGLPFHVGVVTKNGYMIHCAKDINTVHENFTSMRWQNKVVGFARWIS